MFLIHYTDRCNLEMIRECRVLKCARSLMTPDEVTKWARVPRQEPVPLSCRAVLRDQQPLLDAAEPEHIEYLNEHVFFWAESEGGKGNFLRHMFYQKYKRRKCFHLGLRCSLCALREANPCVGVSHAPHNVGTTQGKTLRHRPLQPHEEKRAKEVVVRGEVRLPDSTEQKCDGGQWVPFFR